VLDKEWLLASNNAEVFIKKLFYIYKGIPDFKPKLLSHWSWNVSDAKFNETSKCGNKELRN
jgi:hypothetical protein